MSEQYCFVEIIVSVRGTSGYSPKFEITKEEIDEAERDPLAFAAKCYVRCLARTKNGKQCNGVVPGVRCETPGSWAAHSGGYCHIHGGT